MRRFIGYLWNTCRKPQEIFVVHLFAIGKKCVIIILNQWVNLNDDAHERN